MPSSCVEVWVHFVWATAGREPLITDERAARIYGSIRESCTQLGCVAVAIGGVADHVHVLVRMHAATSVAAVAHRIKGASSHLMTHIVAPDAYFAWQTAYGAFSVSADHVDRVVDYIGH